MSDLFDADTMGDVATHAQAAPSAGMFDPQMLKDVVSANAEPEKASTAAEIGKSAIDIAKSINPSHPIQSLATGYGETLLGGITGGVGSLADALTGADPGTHDWAYRPRTQAGQAIGGFFGSESKGLGQLYDAVFGTGPAATTVKERVPEALGAAGTVSAIGGLAKSAVGAASAPAEAATVGRAGPDGSVGAAAVEGGARGVSEADPLGQPVEGGLPSTAHSQRADILNRVGIENARESAIKGEAGSAAVDYQLTKFREEAAGQAASEQFQSEKNALAGHVEKLIGDTGGTIGTEQDQLINRGKTIAQPFDMLREYMRQKTNDLYAEADKRAGGTPITNLQSVDKLLNDPTFRNTLGAKDQQGLLNAVKNQLDFFRQNNPQGFTAAGAEQFRQWLNQIWSSDNKNALGQLKDAVDRDVTSVGGADLYNQARAMHQLRKTVFDETKGVSKLFGVDDGNPINRNTEYEQIPDKLTSLGSGQFKYIMDQLRGMPEALQADAQAAISEIKGHLLNKVLDAGTKSSRDVPSQLWGTDRVNSFIKNNAQTLNIAFSDDPEILNSLKDVKDAGNILRVDQSYPGAYAQATQAIKRGIVPRVIQNATAAAGAGIGGVVGGPIGAAAGAAGGEAVGASVAGRMTEAAALKKFQKRIVKTGNNP